MAEETQDARLNAARGIFWSTVASGVGGFASTILFLFCAVSRPEIATYTAMQLTQQPSPDILFSYGGPQPFVSLYAVVLGQKAHVVMNIVCVVALWLVRVVRCLPKTPRLE